MKKTLYIFFFFFFQAEDGIRDADVTGVQTCVFRSSGSNPTKPCTRGPSLRQATLAMASTCCSMLSSSSSSSHLEKSTIAGVINTSRDFCPTMKLIKLLRQLVAMAGVQESPSDVTADQVVARIEFIRHGVDLERRQTSQY